MDLCRELHLSYLHVFPYSVRPGTRAADLSGHLARAEIRRRASELLDVGRALRLAFHRAHVGRRVEVLVEGEVKGRPGWLRGFTDSYLHLKTLTVS